MAIQYFDSPFHVTHGEGVANQMTEEMKLSMLITDCIKNPSAKENEAAVRSTVADSRISDITTGKIE